jgi:hypothetical protein
VTLASPVLVVCLVVLSLAGCTSDDSQPSTDGAATHGQTSATSPTSGAVATPELPAPVSMAGGATVRLTRVETARLDLDSPDWLTVTAGALWVKLDPGTVVRVNPATAKVQKQVPPADGPGEFNLCQGFGNSGDAVWSCTPFGSIERIDAETSRVTDNLVMEMRSDQGHLVSASDRLWIITRSGDSIAGIGLDDHELGAPIPLGAFCTDLAAEGPTVWAVCPGDNQVLRVDTDTGEVTGRLGLPAPRQVSVRDDVWVTFEDGVAQIEPETLSVEAVYDVPAGLGGGIWAGTDWVWVRCDGGPFLVGIDPVAHRVVASVTAADLPSGGEVLGVGNQLWATAYNDATLVRLRPPA